MNQRFTPRPLLLVVWLTLLAALAGSALISHFVPALGGWRMAIHLGIAVFMAALVAAIFMNLRAAGPLLRMFALAGLLFLFFLLLLTPTDYLAR